MPSASLTLLKPKRGRRLLLPLYGFHIPAGFPSPADDYIEGKLDLNSFLVPRPAATFFVRVTGTSMLGAGIHPGDILIVDRSVEAVPGKVVVAAVNGELTVKRLQKREEKLYLAPENGEYPPILFTEGTEVAIWGVVTSVIHKV